MFRDYCLLKIEEYDLMINVYSQLIESAKKTRQYDMVSRYQEWEIYALQKKLEFIKELEELDNGKKQ